MATSGADRGDLGLSKKYFVCHAERSEASRFNLIHSLSVSCRMPPRCFLESLRSVVHRQQCPAQGEGRQQRQAQSRPAPSRAYRPVRSDPAAAGAGKGKIDSLRPVWYTPVHSKEILLRCQGGRCGVQGGHDAAGALPAGKGPSAHSGRLSPRPLRWRPPRPGLPVPRGRSAPL